MRLRKILIISVVIIMALAVISACSSDTNEIDSAGSVTSVNNNSVASSVP